MDLDERDSRAPVEHEGLAFDERDFESAVLHAALHARDMRSAVLDLLDHSCFHYEIHRDVWDEVVQAYEREQDPDVFAVYDRMRERYGDALPLFILGGSETFDWILTPEMARSAARSLRRRAALRIRERVARSATNGMPMSAASMSDLLVRAGQLEEGARPRPTRLATSLVPSPDYASVEIPEPPSLLGKRLLVAGAAGIIHGKPGTGKTWIVMELARAIARGEEWFGIPTVEGGAKVAMLELELDGFETQSRCRALGIGSHPLDANLGIISRWKLKGAVDLLNDPDGIAELRELIEHHGLKLLVIDALRRAHTGDEKESQDMAKILLPLDVVRQETGCAILIVHHDRKGQGDRKGVEEDGDQLSGSGALASFPTFQVRVKKSGGSRQIVFVKTSCGLEPAPIHYRLAEETGLPFVVPAPDQVLEDNRAKVLRTVLESAFPVSSMDVSEATGLAYRTVVRHLAALVDSGAIDCSGKARSARYFPGESRQNPATPPGWIL